MNCKDMEERLITYIDGELSLEENMRVKEHLENCSTCMEEYEKLKTDFDKITKEKDDLNQQFTNQKTIIEENKNNINSLQKEIDRLKIKNYEYFEQLSTQNNSDGSNNSNNKNNEEKNPSINDILKMF